MHFDSRSALVRAPLRTWAVIYGAVFLTDALQMIRSRPGWLGWAPAAASQFQVADLTAAPIAAVACALISGIPRRAGLSAWVRLQEGPHRSTGLNNALFVGSAAAVAHLVVAGAAVVGCRVTAPGVPLHLAAWLSCFPLLASVFLWAAVGALVGRLLNPVFAIGICSTLPYLLTMSVLFNLADSWWTTLAPYTASVYTIDGPAVEASVLRTWVLAWAALGACALIKGARPRLLRAGTMVVAGCATMAVLGLPVIHYREADQITCAKSSSQNLTACVPRVFAAVLPSYLSVTSHLNAQLPPEARIELVYPTEMLTPPSGSKSAAVSPVNSPWSPSFTIDRAEYTAMFGRATLGRICSLDGVAGPAATAAAQIWWRQTHALGLEPLFPGDDQLTSAPYYTRALQLAQTLQSHTAAEDSNWLHEHVRFGC